jgi:phosphate transport system substrate-binding protein
MLLALTACGGGETASNGQATGTASGAAGASGRAITVKGSDTMVVLGQRFAEEYMKANPGSVIQVNGGGSGTGIAALINGTVDLAQSSREMKQKERDDVKKNRNADIQELPVALDALAVFVHATNPLKELSMQQLEQIYTGKLTNWSQVGGSNAPIVLYGRENSSGTYEYFKEHVLNKADFAPRVQTLAGTAAVINAVSRDVNAIGYGGIAYSSGVRAVPVKKDATSPAIAPNEESVKAGTYPIARKLYFYYATSARPDVQTFARWAISPEAQSIVTKVGYFPIGDAPAAAPTDTATTAAPATTSTAAPAAQ